MSATVIASVLRVSVGRFVFVFVRNSVECSREIQEVERLKTWLSTSVSFFLDVDSYFAFHVCGSGLELEGKRDGSRVKGDYFHDHLRYHVGFGDVLDCRRSPACIYAAHEQIVLQESVVYQSVEVIRRSFCRASSRSELVREASFGLSRRRAL